MGATEQTLLAAVLAEGKTELSGAATEPEIMDLVCVLQKMGAIISVDGGSYVQHRGREGTEGLHAHFADRPHRGRFLGFRGIGHAWRHFRQGATQPEMMTFLNVFRKIGGEFDITDNGIRFWIRAAI